MKYSILFFLSFTLLASPPAKLARRHRLANLANAATIQPPDPSLCTPSYGVPCYSPQQLQDAFGLTPLLRSGYDGKGQTIVIIESFGSPTIKADLKAFDEAYNLPDPPSFQVLAPLGTVPFDPTNSDQVTWAFETTLDVQWAHAMAPGASIVVLTSPVDETEGVQGLPQFLELERYAISHHLGKIISQSWGTTENTLFDPAGLAVINEFEKFYEHAAAHDVTVLAGAGDSGTSNVDLNNNPYTFPTVLFPASSPYVMAVGGTTLEATSSGSYESETVWNDATGATGGGVSQYFREPEYQRALPQSVQAQIADHRGLPDVVFNADPVFIYIGFYSDPADNGFYTNGGTSESTPAWAGVISIANQIAGRPMGLVNPTLYFLGAFGEQAEFFHDITTGNNGANGVAGYNATPGWDLASGWGSPNPPNLVWEMGH
jgi:subtilase family serine protease